MSQKRMDRKTMAVCYAQAEQISTKIKRVAEDCTEKVRYITSSGVQQSLAGGDGDLIVDALKGGIEVLERVIDKMKQNILEPLDGKILSMKTVTSDQSDVNSKARKLKENASTVSSLKR